jgi:coenzyme F420-0:L-glutamate ligase / coenzyme F420-1:gamma-L-glutamate ligase
VTEGERLTLTALPGVPLIHEGADLVAAALEGLSRASLSLVDGDILVFAQKIVSKAEGRRVALSHVTPSPRAQALAPYVEKDPRFVEVVLRESREVLRVRPGLLVVEHRLGFVCANAGVDRSNVAPHDANEEWVLLLPEDPDGSCRRLRSEFQARAGAQVGVIINDSHGRAWRNGTVGVAVGVAGLPAVQDMRGHPDLFDYTLQVTQIGTADELAAAASLLMGQADEGRPIIHVRGFPYPMREAGLAELLRPHEIDAFR